MWKAFRLIPAALKYLINVGPLLYDAVKFGIKVVKELRPKKEVHKVKPFENVASKKRNIG